MVQRITDGGLPGHGVAKRVKRSKKLIYFQTDVVDPLLLSELSFCCSGVIKSADLYAGLLKTNTLRGLEKFIRNKHKTGQKEIPI